MKRYLHLLSILVLIYATFSFITVTPSMAGDAYLGGEIGVVFYPDATVNVPAFGSADLASKEGYLIGILVGTKFDVFRLEGELAYRANDADELKGPGGTAPVTGDTTSTSLMVNGYYDIKTSSSVTPYLGAGIGFSNVSVDYSDAGVKLADDSDMVFSYQFIAGVGFDINPKLKLDLSYKYFATTTPSYKDVFGDSFDVDYNTHNVQIGLRYSF